MSSSRLSVSGSVEKNFFLSFIQCRYSCLSLIEVSLAFSAVESHQFLILEAFLGQTPWGDFLGQVFSRQFLISLSKSSTSFSTVWTVQIAGHVQSLFISVWKCSQLQRL